VIRNHPTWAPLSVVGAQIYAARGNPVQEIAFSFTIAKAYIDALLERGFTIDEVAPYVRHITGIDTDFFEAIAKLRAYRKVWGRLMKEHYGATSEASTRLQLMSSPGTMDMTLQQPLNNIARLGIQMLACAMAGGAYTINTPLHDEAHALPSEEAIAIGASIHNIVAHESGVANTIDPLAGSYFVEFLTKRMEDEVWEEIEKIDAMGGALVAIETGYFQRKLAEQQCMRNRALETGERKLVGVNYLAKADKKREIEIFKLDDASEKRQLERLRVVREQRDSAAVKVHLEQVRAACRDGSNLVPPILEAVKAYATLGEICDVMRNEFGEHDPNALTPDM
jgi:methylmalonyl-CoA mutase N-terminal domain/subunit